MSSPERSRPRPRKRPQTPPKRDSSTPEPEQQQTPPSSAKGMVAPTALTEARAGVDISRAGTPPKRAATQKAEGSTNRDPSAKPHAETTTSKGSHDHHDSAPKPVLPRPRARMLAMRALTGRRRHATLCVPDGSRTLVKQGGVRILRCFSALLSTHHCAWASFPCMPSGGRSRRAACD